MAVRVKTIEYPFVANTSALALNTRYVFTTQTLYIPETTSRAFRSVALQISAYGSETAATSWGTCTLEIILAAVAASTSVVGTVVANSGEQQFHVFTRDVTSYFTSNFGTGVSQTCSCAITIAAVATIGLSAKLIITYEYEEQDTSVKTVRIPIESPTTGLTASLVETGTSQCPNLSTFLPESSGRTIRAIWFEFYFNTGAVATTDHQLNFACDSDAASGTGLFESSQNSAVGCTFIWVKKYHDNTGTAQAPNNAYSESATHSLKFAYVGAATFQHPAAILCVTYEYSHTNATTILNSLVMGMPYMGFITGTAATDIDRCIKKFFVQEASPTLVQSGVMLSYSSIANVSLNVKFGSQSGFKTWTNPTSLYCGSNFLMQRIDSGSSVGAAFSLARGLNSFAMNCYASVAGNDPSGIGAMIIVNYTSTKHASGDGAHNHSTYWLIDSQTNIAAGTHRLLTATQKVYIPETSYYLNGCSANFRGMIYGVNATPSASGWAFAAEAASGELDGGGWANIAKCIYAYEGETGWYPTFIACDPDTWKQYPTDPNHGMDIESSRRMMLNYPTSTHSAMFLVANYHAITYTISGTISSNTSGVTVDIFRSDTDELIGTVTTTSGGAYTFTWYDNTIACYAAARESAVLTGRSEDGVAT